MTSLFAFAKSICGSFSRGVILKPSHVLQSAPRNLSTCGLLNPTSSSVRPTSLNKLAGLPAVLSGPSRTFMAIPSLSPTNLQPVQRPLLHPIDLCNVVSRKVTKFAIGNGGRKRSVATVLHRFFRLHNGLWIRRIPGYSRKMHKKTEEQKLYLRNHLFVSRSQCIMFDKMVTKFYKKKTYFIDDPYEPYHVRNNYDYVIPKEKWGGMRGKPIIPLQPRQ